LIDYGSMRRKTILSDGFKRNAKIAAPASSFRRQILAVGYVFVVVLLGMFTSELAVNDILSSFAPGLDPVCSSLADATILSLSTTAFCWLTIIRPLARGKSTASTVNATRQVLNLLLSIFLVEFLVMLAFSLAAPVMDPEVVNLLNAVVTTMLVAPLLWWLLFQPLPDSQRLKLIEEFASPLKLYVILIITVFVADFTETILLPLFLPYSRGFSHRFMDAFLASLLAAPFLWILLVRPLRRAVNIEKTYFNVIRDQVRDAIIIIDADGNIEMFNAAAEKIFGYGSAAIAGKSLALLLGGTEQLDRLLSSASAETPDNSSVTILDVIAKRQDGFTLEMAVSVSQINLGENLQYLAILRDFTDRRKIETSLRESSVRFRELFEQTEDAIIFFKPGCGTIIDANATAERLFGYSRSKLTDGGLPLICRASELAWLQDIISNVTAARVLQLQNLIALNRDGKEINISLHAKTVTIMGVAMTYCTIRDISDRIRMETEARDMQAKLIQANKMTSLGLLVSGVAHEINNPNAFIMANAELLNRTWVDAIAVLREYYQEHGDFQLGGLPFSVIEKSSPTLFSGIIEGAKRIDGIVDNLREFAREERGGNIVSVDINRVATTAVTIIHHQLMKYTMNFRLELGGDIPPVKGSYQQLEQVIINLLLNAGQALPSKNSFIWLDTGFDADTGQVIVTLRDEGRGMTPEESDRIMEPFFTTKLDSGGTGLGLSISNSIIKEHNGTLEFESEPGKGTVFFIKLPVSNQP